MRFPRTGEPGDSRHRSRAVEHLSWIKAARREGSSIVGAMPTVPITYFSDVLCVWAYIAQLRVDELTSAFGAQVSLTPRFCNVFGDTARKVATQWGEKGGYEGFNAHLQHSVAAFPELTLNQDIWRSVRPASSASPHLFLKAAQIAEDRNLAPAGTADRATRDMRRAFFHDARDIGLWDVQCAVARETGVDVAVIDGLIRDGAAFAALASDYHDAGEMGVQGSPTFVLNGGRQKLYGNVGYKIIEANVAELIRDPNPDRASWC